MLEHDLTILTWVKMFSAGLIHEYGCFVLCWLGYYGVLEKNDVILLV